MKKLKVSFSALALLLGIGAAFATQRNTADRRWHLNDGVYEEVTGSYDCIESEDICTETFDSRVNPNDQANDSYPGTAAPTSSDEGTFL